MHCDAQLVVLTAHKIYCTERKKQLIIKFKRRLLAAWYLIGFPAENT